MDKVNESFEGFLQGKQERLKICNEISMKTHLKKYIVDHPNKIYGCLNISKNVEIQIAIINMILKVLSKDEIVQNKILLDYELDQIPKTGNKIKILNLLKNFNSKETTKVAGAEFDKLESINENLKEVVKEMKGGFIFIGDESFRIQENNEVIVLFFKSIQQVKIEGICLTIEITENRKICIKLKYNQDLSRFKARISELFYQVEAQDSIVLNIGKRVSFSPEIEDKERANEELKTNKEERINANITNNYDFIKNVSDLDFNKNYKLGSSTPVIAEITKSDLLTSEIESSGFSMIGGSLMNGGLEISSESELANRISIRKNLKKQSIKNSIKNNIKHKSRNSSIKKNLKKQSIKSLNKRSRNGSMKTFKLTPLKKSTYFNKKSNSFQKVPVFRRIDSKIAEIYKSKLELAELTYKNMKREANRFKAGLDKLKGKKVAEMKLS